MVVTKCNYKSIVTVFFVISMLDILKIFSEFINLTNELFNVVMLTLLFYAECSTK